MFMLYRVTYCILGDDGVVFVINGMYLVVMRFNSIKQIKAVHQSM